MEAALELGNRVEVGIILSYMLKLWMLRAILVRYQMEMRNMLSETGGKAISVIKWQTVAELCPSVL